ncbi:cation/H(+) antiporter 15-like [Mercurialis annua]|uniref:cation/H(+) antiporter 15-like n=1 Tax=Mercurialis annua TaxID=3986 RepID=UPI00215FCF63|nr:cation/H(+) antiporter 15-like [Mercurialis annua]
MVNIVKSIFDYCTSLFHVQNMEKKMINHEICTPYHVDIYGATIFSTHGKINPLDYTFPIFLAQIILSILSCKLVYFALGHWIRSKLLCNVLAGLILGPSVMGKISSKYMETIFPDKDMFVFNTMVKVGIGYYFFITAVKMDTAMMLKTAKNIPVLANGLSVTFYSNIASAMEEHNLLTTELGQLAMSSAMLIDSIAWFHVIITVIMFQGNAYSSIRLLISMFVFVLILIYIIRPAIVKIIKRIPEGSCISENIVIGMLISALIMGLITELTFGGFYLGTLLMGLVIPDGPPLGSELVEKAGFMVMEYFQPMFFVLIGYYIDFSLMVHNKEIGLLVMFIVGSHLAKILGALFASIFVKINVRNAALVAICLNFRGIVDLTVYERWLIKGVIDKRMFSTLVLTNMFLTGIYGFLLDKFYKPEIRLANSPPTQKYFRTLQSTPSDEELRILTIIHNEDNVHSIIAFLEASYPNETSSINVNVIHAVDLAGRSGPKITPYTCASHRRKYQSNTTQQVMRAFANYSRNSSGPVSIRPFILAAPFKTIHTIICNYAEDNWIPFIIVPFVGENDLEENSNIIRDFNAHQLQENSPCTVGILVDRGFRSRINRGGFSYNVLVIFLGGPDDREALKLAIRMSGNRDVSIKILKFKLMQEPDEKPDELDELLIQEFKVKNSNKISANFHEIEVENTSTLLTTVGSLENIYDLIIVGKLSGKIKSVKEIIKRIDHPELGVIGDAIIKSDFEDSISVLVMQHTLRVDKINQPR